MMGDFMKGAGFAVGLLLTSLAIAAYALRKDYAPMKDRPLGEDEYGEWVVVPPSVTTTFN